MTSQRVQARRFILWTGIALCCTMANAWIVSANLAVGFRGKLGFGLQHGSFAVIHDSAPPTTGWVIWNTNRVALTERRLPDVSWWFVHRNGPGWRWWAIPLWMPFSLVALTTGMYWYRTRLNARNDCPECGTKGAKGGIP